ncbi:unnamed protein product [Closterium sp. Naga37s-1]|nr:unnamed protein product [Closterium sp. Naga37s-1]
MCHLQSPSCFGIAFENLPKVNAPCPACLSCPGCFHPSSPNRHRQERKDAIWAASNELAASVGGSIPEDARGDLLAEVANLVESPVPLLGSFDRSFLDLPPEVLVMVMRKHQRYFPVQDAASGKLLPYFVAVPNGRLDEAAVRAGNESVLRARYEDARFFYNSDTAHPLESFREKLKGITFQAKLGSMLDKSERIEAITPLLCTALHLSPSDFAAAQQAARLCMADLGTAVVMEFTGLAGIMGRHYAEREGLGEEVSRAIFECVLPRSAGDQLPTTAPGLVLSLATSPAGSCARAARAVTPATQEQPSLAYSRRDLRRRRRSPPPPAAITPSSPADTTAASATPLSPPPPRRDPLSPPPPLAAAPDSAPPAHPAAATPRRRLPVPPPRRHVAAFPPPRLLRRRLRILPPRRLVAACPSLRRDVSSSRSRRRACFSAACASCRRDASSPPARPSAATSRRRLPFPPPRLLRRRLPVPPPRQLVAPCPSRRRDLTSPPAHSATATARRPPARPAAAT